MLAQEHGVGREVKEQEIDSFGTGKSNGVDADTAYDGTYMNDPGHVSRGEIRFNAALK